MTSVNDDPAFCFPRQYRSGCFTAHRLVRDGGPVCRWTDCHAKKYRSVPLAVAR